jgi:hypothetical protein
VCLAANRHGARTLPRCVTVLRELGTGKVGFRRRIASPAAMMFAMVLPPKVLPPKTVPVPVGVRDNRAVMRLPCFRSTIL